MNNHQRLSVRFCWRTAVVAPVFAATMAIGGQRAAAEDTATTEASTPAAQMVVKKSGSGICHDTSSPFYEQTLRFEPFDSMEACLASGGRLPKNVVQDVAKLPVRKSTSGICHDASSPNYASMKHFETYPNMEACVNSGGRARK